MRHGRPRARSGASYQCLPTPETKPKTKCSCMWNPLPNLTGSCARGAKPIGAFGLVMAPLPFPTNRPFWLCAIIRQYYQSLPAAVLNTHNDIKHTVLHPDSGPTGMGLVHPERHQSLEVDTHHTHDPASTLGQGPTWLTPRPRHRLDTTANTVAKQVNLVMIP